MPLQLRWIDDAADDESLGRVARARALAYAPAAADMAGYRDRLRADPRAVPGDWLLAELDGEPIGTATSLSMATWARGGHAWCQGVAYVGTARTHRRTGSADGQPGVASQIMHALLDRARDRGQSVSALMPFRNSFYERFGYGAVERRHEWTLPTSLLPSGDAGGFRPFDPAVDLDELAACRQRLVCRGQLDVKRTGATWAYLLARRAADGWFLVDRPDPGGPVRGYVGFDTVVRPADGRWHLRVTELGYADAAGLRRALHLLAGQKDQYATLSLALPADVPLNRLLRETQLPHRVVPHAAAECRPQTRLMVRVLDHATLLGAMTGLPPDHRGSAVVAVHEPEGSTSTFAVEVGGGRAAVNQTTASPQFECSAATWAAIACGDVPATQVVRLGLATCAAPATAAALDALAVGPPPFCTEAF